MSERRFWTWYDRAARADFAGTLIGLVFDWRPYAAGLGGWLVSFIALPAISDWSPAQIWMASIASGFLITLAFFAACGGLVLLSKWRSSRKDARPARSYEFEKEIPDLRVADSQFAIDLFKGVSRDKLIPLLESESLTAWGRPMSEGGEPPPIKIPGSIWRTHRFINLPKTTADMRNQTFIKTKVGDISNYYDVHLNQAQIAHVWPAEFKASERFEPRLIPGRLALARALDDLYAEGVRHRNSLIPAIPEFDYGSEHQKLNDWDARVQDQLDDKYVAMREKSAFRTLNLFEPKFHTAKGKDPHQDKIEAIWTEKLDRLKVIIRKVGS